MRGLRPAVAVTALTLAAGASCHPQPRAARPAPALSGRAAEPTSPGPTGPTPTSPSATSAVGRGGSSPACPAAYAAPDPHRPVVWLTFELSNDRRTVRGTELVRFTPDRPITELVFRLWPNGATAPAHTRLAVNRAVSPGGGAFTTQQLGAKSGTQGTLLSIPLGRTAPAGRPVEADLAFMLALPGPTFERWGSTGSTAWWASGHPLLAWDRGRGWAREPAVGIPAEAAVSEAARSDITVTAPAGDEVLMTGVTDRPGAPAGGRRRWHATAATARDVSVSVGRFARLSMTIAGVAVTAAVASDTVAAPGRDTDVTPEHLLAEVRRSMQALAGLYGPFPYPSLVVTALPSLRSGGIEYPGAIMAGPERWRVVVPHETAHQYFYGLVGDDQARDPWLDEAFATYSEARVNGSEQDYLPSLAGPLPVGRSMQAWGADATSYAATVYSKGAAALLTARERAGGTRFDQALRCYVRVNAWSVAAPAALARALAGLPAAINVLRQAGALP